MNISRLFIIGSLFVAALSLQHSYAQDCTRKGLPDGARMRLGKGWISGDMTFSPDGTVLAVPCRTGVWLYDVTTGAEINLLVGHSRGVESVAFSPDGTKLASGSWDTTIRLWDVRTGKGTHTLAGHRDSVRSLVFSPDGLTLASRGRDEMIRLWDVDTGEPLRALEGLEFGSRNNEVRLWDASTGETASTVIVGLHQHWLSPIVFLQSGPVSVSGSSDDRIRTWSAHVVEAVPSLEGSRDRVEAVVFSPDGSTLAATLSWRDEVEIQLWAARTGEFLYYLTGHWSARNTLRDIYVAFSPDGDTLASVGSSSSIVRLWDARTGELLGRPETSTSTVSSIAFSPDGSVLFWTRGNAIQSWNAHTECSAGHTLGDTTGLSVLSRSLPMDPHLPAGVAMPRLDCGMSMLAKTSSFLMRTKVVLHLWLSPLTVSRLPAGEGTKRFVSGMSAPGNTFERFPGKRMRLLPWHSRMTEECWQAAAGDLSLGLKATITRFGFGMHEPVTICIRWKDTREVFPVLRSSPEFPYSPAGVTITRFESGTHEPVKTYIFLKATRIPSRL